DQPEKRVHWRVVLAIREVDAAYPMAAYDRSQSRQAGCGPIIEVVLHDFDISRRDDLREPIQLWVDQNASASLPAEMFGYLRPEVLHQPPCVADIGVVV